MGNKTRQAALYLLAMSEQDREWHLEQLPEQIKGEVQILLDELESQGIVQSHVLASRGTLFEEALRTANQHIDNKLVDQLDIANPKTIERVISEESDDFIALLLAIKDWSWSSTVMEHCITMSKSDMIAKIASVKTRIPPKLRDTTIEKVHQRVSQWSRADTFTTQSRRKGSPSRWFRNVLWQN